MINIIVTGPYMGRLKRVEAKRSLFGDFMGGPDTNMKRLKL